MSEKTEIADRQKEETGEFPKNWVMRQEFRLDRLLDNVIHGPRIVAEFVRKQ